MIGKDFQNEIINLVKQLENDFDYLEREKNSEKIESFLLDNDVGVQRRFSIVLKLGQLIKKAIKTRDGSENKKKDLADEIKNYFVLMFKVIREENLDDYIRCEIAFELGQIGCCQYDRLFETNNDLILEELVNVFKEVKNEIVKGVIANAFWHLAGEEHFPEKYKEVLRELHNNSKNTIKHYLKMALLSLGEVTEE